MKLKQQTPNPNSVWNKYNKMIMKIAHKLSKKYNQPYDELLSEGILRVFKNLVKWNPDRSNLCTYVYQCAMYGMLDYCIKPIREIPMSEFNENPHKSSPEKSKESNPWIEKATQPNWFQSFLNEISEETQQLIKIIFETPEELREVIIPSHPKTSQKKLRIYMIDVLDWTSIDVEKAFKEIAECL